MPAPKDFVVPHGFPLEEHFVTTPGGFILRLFRIPHGTVANNSSSSSSSSSASASNNGGGPSSSGSPRPVAFMQHALMDSSVGWVLLGPRRALAFQLAEAGFDVWIANTRGAHARRQRGLG
jgi:lysosomal acid lipase/cholesteryl ester hydrolase